MPAPARSLVTVVGGDESEEFHRQAALIAEAWGPRAVAAARGAGRNHMDVLHELAEPGDATYRLALQLLGLGAELDAGWPAPRPPPDPGRRSAARHAPSRRGSRAASRASR